MITDHTFDMFDDKLYELKQDLNRLLVYIKSNTVDVLFSDELFWKNMTVFSQDLTQHVRQQQSLKSYGVVQEWLRVLESLMAKDINLITKVLDGPIKMLMYDLLNIETDIPTWFIDICFEVLYEYINRFHSLLSRLFKMILCSTEFFVQKTFIDIIIKKVDYSQIYLLVNKYITSKELQKLFIRILEDEDQKNVRSFLHTLNSMEKPTKIFSFLSAEIILNTFLLVKNVYINFNVSRKTITFSIKIHNFKSDDIASSILDGDEEAEDIVTIYFIQISYLRFKSECDSYKITLELNKPCSATHKRSIAFLEPYRVITFHIFTNNLFHNFILDHFCRKEKEFPNDLLNFELNLSQSMESLSPVPMLSALVPSSEIPEIGKEEIIDTDEIQNDIYSNIISATPCTDLSSNAPGNQMILQTPDYRRDNGLNISVSETIVTNDSICYDSEEESDRPHTEFYSSFRCTPYAKSTPVPASHSSHTNMYSPDMHSDKNSEVSEDVKSKLLIRTPEILNKTFTDVIDLISPDTSVCHSSELQEHFEPVNDNNEKSAERKQEDFARRLSQEFVPTPTKEICIIKVRPVIEPIPSSKETDPQENILDPSNLGNLHTSQTLNTSPKSKKTQKNNNQDEPPSEIDSTASQIGDDHLRKRRNKRKLSSDKNLDKPEFDATSFFSDVESGTNDVTFTRTRMIKKRARYQYGCDESTNKKTAQLKARKKIKTLTPVIRPENNCNSQNENSIRNPEKRIISNVNQVDHLEEQPTTPVFKLNVPNSSKNQQSIPQNPQTIQSTLQEENQVMNEIPYLTNYDKFDKMKFNILSQKTVEHKKISFFTSSSSSQNSPPIQDVDRENERFAHRQVNTSKTREKHSETNKKENVKDRINTFQTIEEESETNTEKNVQNKDQMNTSKIGGEELVTNKKKTVKNKSASPTKKKFDKKISKTNTYKKCVAKVVDKNNKEKSCPNCGSSKYNLQDIRHFIQIFCDMYLCSVSNEQCTDFCNEMQAYFQEKLQGRNT